MSRLRHATALDADFRAACARAESDEPFHGAFALRVGDKVREYRVGKRGFPELRIIPWQHPYARAFYEGKPGEAFDYEPETDGAGARFTAVEGAIEHLSRVTARERALSRVVFDDASGRSVLVREGDAFVVDDDGSRGRERQQHGLPDVLALLTPEQYRLITRGRGTPLILQGCAGSGKTTVALHRVAFLTHPDASESEPPIDPRRVLVVMFNKALSTFVDQSLGPLGLQEVVLDTFHAWALAAIRRAYRGDISPKSIEHRDREVALDLKRQVGVLSLLSSLVDRARRGGASRSVWSWRRIRAYVARQSRVCRLLDRPRADCAGLVSCRWSPRSLAPMRVSSDVSAKRMPLWTGP
jgi:DNA helicase-2/ATP-dependent DNA helicase PcrA